MSTIEERDLKSKQRNMGEALRCRASQPRSLGDRIPELVKALAMKGLFFGRRGDGKSRTRRELSRMARIAWHSRRSDVRSESISLAVTDRHLGRMHNRSRRISFLQPNLNL